MLGRWMVRMIPAGFAPAMVLLAFLSTPGTADEVPKDTTKKDTKATSDQTTTTAADTDESTWTILENRLTMRAPFNEFKGKVRVIAFFSPTCPRCLKNAGQIKSQFLSKNDSDDLRMMIVWVKSLSTDSEEKLPLAIEQITDPRVTHFWDEKRALNPQLIDAIMFSVNMNVYDVFLLYDKEQLWEQRLPRPGYFFHEVKRMPGPWWNLPSFIQEMEKALDDKAFGNPW